MSLTLSAQIVAVMRPAHYQQIVITIFGCFSENFSLFNLKNKVLPNNMVLGTALHVTYHTNVVLKVKSEVNNKRNFGHRV